jgi:hypothetical protein
MLKTENCPTAAVSYSTERMVLNQNRDIALVLEAPIGNIDGRYDHNDRLRMEEVRRTNTFLFASYLPLLLATNVSDEDSSGVIVLIVCCLVTFFLFGGRRSKQIKD